MREIQPLPFSTDYSLTEGESPQAELPLLCEFVFIEAESVNEYGHTDTHTLTDRSSKGEGSWSVQWNSRAASHLKMVFFKCSLRTAEVTVGCLID